MDIHKILFLDIETVPQYEDYGSAPDDFKALWDEKSRYFQNEGDENGMHVFDRAGIYAEFGRIVCISVGMIAQRGSARNLRLKSFYGEDERILLGEFAAMVQQHFNGADHLLCGHNGKEFDFPYIARRMLVNGLKIPRIFDVMGKKPWEVAHLDTMQMWKFGDYKHYTSLKLLAHVFGLPTPKDDIDGSMVAGVYWRDHDLERIVRYCEKDVITLVQVFLKLMQLPVLTDAELSDT